MSIQLLVAVNPLRAWLLTQAFPDDQWECWSVCGRKESVFISASQTISFSSEFSVSWSQGKLEVCNSVKCYLSVQEQALVQADLEWGNLESSPCTWCPGHSYFAHLAISLLKIVLLLLEMARATLWVFLPVASVKCEYQHTVIVYLSRPALDQQGWTRVGTGKGAALLNWAVHLEGISVAQLGTEVRLPDS